MQRNILNIETIEVNDELKQGFTDYFFHLQNEKKEKINLIWKNFVKYKIIFPHSNPALLDRNEIFEEIYYANYIENRMMLVAETIGNIKAMQNYFR